MIPGIYNNYLIFYNSFIKLSYTKSSSNIKQVIFIVSIDILLFLYHYWDGETKMAWQILDDLKKIRQIISYLITQQTEIKIRIKEDETVFTTKFIKIDQIDILSDIGRSRLVIEKLQPEEGNALIKSSSTIEVLFSIKGNLCRCSLDFIEISNTYPLFGFIMSFPAVIEIEEKRKEERVVHKKPELYSVEFILGEKSQDENRYRFDLYDSSKHGLCMIIPQESINILRNIDIGDIIENITFYGSWTVIKVDGTVRHITKIDEGKFKGGYLVGIESSDIIESIKPEE